MRDGRRNYLTDPDDNPACKGHNPEVWFPLPSESAKPAKAICRRCPIQDPCLTYALQYAVHGIWAATTIEDRAAIREARGIVPLPVVPGGRVRHGALHNG